MMIRVMMGDYLIEDPKSGSKSTDEERFWSHLYNRILDRYLHTTWSHEWKREPKEPSHEN